MYHTVVRVSVGELVGEDRVLEGVLHDLQSIAKVLRHVDEISHSLSRVHVHVVSHSTYLYM